jgi:hypothetical protein
VEDIAKHQGQTSNFKYQSRPDDEDYVVDKVVDNDDEIINEPQKLPPLSIMLEITEEADD